MRWPILENSSQTPIADDNYPRRFSLILDVHIHFRHFLFVELKRLIIAGYLGILLDAPYNVEYQWHSLEMEEPFASPRPELNTKRHIRKVCRSPK